ncbi:TonB-dependent receptor [Achromobacter insuavis]
MFKPQSEKSSSGKPLDPLLGTNYEIGLKGELLDGRINTAIALFRVDQKNRSDRLRQQPRLRRRLVLLGRGRQGPQPGPGRRDQR